MVIAKQQSDIWLNDKNWAHAASGESAIAVPPTAIESERHILGSVLAAGSIQQGRQAFSKIGHLSPKHFFLTSHGYVYRAMQKRYLAGEQIDASLVISTLNTKTEKSDQTFLEQVGGEQFVYELAQVTPANLETHLLDVEKAAFRRSIIHLGKRFEKIASQNRLDMPELIHQTSSAFYDTTSQINSVTSGDELILTDAIKQELERLNSDDPPEERISTGFGNLNTALDGGYLRGSLYLFAAPSGWGKSAMLLSLANKVLHAGKRVLFLSLEMDLKRLLWRMAAIESSVKWQRIEKKVLSPDENTRVRNAYTELAGLQASKAFTMIRMNRPTLSEIRAKLDKHRWQSGYDVVFIDYVDSRTISAPSNNRFRSETGEASDVWEGIRDIKDTCGAAVVTAAQLNRDGSKRKGNYTRDAIYGTSSAVNAADFIGLIKRPAIYDETWTTPECAFVEIGKYRDGQDCDQNGNPIQLYMKWEGEFTRFSEWRQPVPGALTL